MLRNDWFGLEVGTVSRNRQEDDKKGHIENEDISGGGPVE